MSWPAILSALKAWGPAALGFLPKIDWRIWATVIALASVLYYGHWSEERGRVQVRTEMAAEVASAVLKIKQADQEALVAAEKRATEARAEADSLKGKIDELNRKAAQAPDAGALCIPADVADGLRGL